MLLLAPNEPEAAPPVTTRNVVPDLPQDVQVLLVNGLCDNIQSVFDMEVQNVPNLTLEARKVALERIEYYREWLRRKNCG